MVDKQFDISQPDLLIPQVKIIARTVPNKCLCFSILYDLMTRMEWYTQPNLLQHRTKLVLFTEVVASAVPKTFATLHSIGGLAEIFLNEIFVYLFSTFFPKDKVQQIVSIILFAYHSFRCNFSCACRWTITYLQETKRYLNLDWL